MSHGDAVTDLPDGLAATARRLAPRRRVRDDVRRLYGVQWHPEVVHSTFGQRVLENFLHRGAGLAGDWDAGASSRSRSPRSASASATSTFYRPPAASTPRSPPPRPQGRRRPVDLRLRRPRPPAGGRPSRSSRTMSPRPGSASSSSTPATASSRPSRGVRPRGEAQDHRPGVHPGLRAGRSRCRRARRGRRAPPSSSRPGHALSRCRRSGGGTRTANIKSHHNVGGLPTTSSSPSSSPLRDLFKDEVRRVGLELGVPRGSCGDSRSLGPGLGIRIVGEADRRAPRDAARRGPDRPPGTHRRRPRPGHLAVPGRPSSPTFARSASRRRAHLWSSRRPCVPSRARTR